MPLLLFTPKVVHGGALVITCSREQGDWQEDSATNLKKHIPKAKVKRTQDECFVLCSRNICGNAQDEERVRTPTLLWVCYDRP